MNEVWCSTCELPIAFDGSSWRHGSDPARDLEHDPTPDIGLLKVRPA